MKKLRKNDPHTEYNLLAEREAELWGVGAGEVPLSWCNSPLIARYINTCVSGDPSRDWLDHFKAEYCKKPMKLGLNVGCGQGELERHILKRGIAQRMEGFDISPQALDIARELAEKAGVGDCVHYYTADANYLEKTPHEQQYDVIFVSMALHHFVELEKCLDNLRLWLKPDGYLVVNEFVGPYRFQWTDAQVDITNRLIACLPMELRRNIREPGKYKYILVRHSLEFMKEHLAFESVCSDRIIPALHKRFDIVEQKNYGGTILHNLFEAIMGNFDEEMNREHALTIRMLIEFEKILLDYGVIEHDHAFLVCKNPS